LLSERGERDRDRDLERDLLLCGGGDIDLLDLVGERESFVVLRGDLLIDEFEARAGCAFDSLGSGAGCFAPVGLVCANDSRLPNSDDIDEEDAEEDDATVDEEAIFEETMGAVEATAAPLAKT